MLSASPTASATVKQMPASKDDIRELLDLHYAKLVNHLENCIARLAVEGVRPVSEEDMEVPSEREKHAQYSCGPMRWPDSPAKVQTHSHRVSECPYGSDTSDGSSCIFEVDMQIDDATDSSSAQITSEIPNLPGPQTPSEDQTCFFGALESDVVPGASFPKANSTSSFRSLGKTDSLRSWVASSSILPAPLQRWRAFIKHSKNEACVRLQDKWYQIEDAHTRSSYFANATSVGSNKEVGFMNVSLGDLLTDAVEKSMAVNSLNHPRLSQQSSGLSATSYMQNRRSLCESLRITVQKFNKQTMLHPNQWIRVVWDMFGIILLMHEFIMIPMQVFDSGTPGLGDSYMTFWNRLDFVGLIFWTCDVIVSFRTGFYSDEGFVEVSTATVSRHYLKTWFPLDGTIVVIDWTAYFLNFSNQVGYLRIGKVVSRTLRILRLLRFMKLGSKFSEMLDRINSEYILTLLGVMKLLFGIIMVNHYIACTWYALSQIDVGRTWADKFLAEEDFAFAYVTSLHWSLTQFTPASMEVHPTNVYERVYTIVVIIAAMVAFSSFVSSITGAMTHLRSINAKKAEQDSNFRQFFISNKISQELARMVWHFRSHNTAVNKLRMKEADLPALKGLPERLQELLRFEVHFPILNGHPFFAVYAEVSPDGISKVCNAAVTERQVLGAEELKDFTGSVHSMVFVRHGILKYLASREVAEESFGEKVSKTLSDAIKKRASPSLSRKSASGRNRKSARGRAIKHRMTMARMPSFNTSAIDVFSGEWACEVALWSDCAKLEGPFCGGQNGCDLTLVNARKFQSIVVAQGNAGAQFVARYARVFVERWNVASSDPLFSDILFNDVDIVAAIVDQAATEIIGEQTEDDNAVADQLANGLKRLSVSSKQQGFMKIFG